MSFWVSSIDYYVYSKKTAIDYCKSITIYPVYGNMFLNCNNLLFHLHLI